MLQGTPVTLERLLDGNLSTLTAMKIYLAGTATEHTLAANELLYITDIIIASEAGADTSINCDSDGDGDFDAGDVLFLGTLDAKDVIVVHFETPFCCPRGKVPKFKGAASDVNFCRLQGYIKEA